MLPQSEYESPMLASAAAPVAIAAITQDRALIGLLRSVIDPTNDLILVTSEAELTPHLSSRRVSVALLGYPENGPFAAVSARLGQTVMTLARDAYGSVAFGRDVVTVRGSIHPGNSGGPAVDTTGRVRAVVYAQRIDKSGGYGVPISFVRDALASVGSTALETDCVDR